MSSIQPLLATPVPSFAMVTSSELDRRPRRAANFEMENRALGDLAEIISASPQKLLQKLADAALRLCNAHSSGVSVIENDTGQAVFRWRAVAGKLAPQIGRTLPRAFSPCGPAVDRDAIQLMSRPAQHFPYVGTLPPAIEEALLVPFHLGGVPLGTIWVVSHDETRRFDAEDARLLTSLGRFAAGACEAMTSLSRLEAESARQRNTNARLTTADQSRDRFLAILGHELRNQLAPTQNAAELLKRDTLDAETRRYVSRIIDRQVGGMTRLVEDLLDMARLRAGNLEMRRADVPLCEIIESTIEIVRPVVAARNHTLVVELPAEPLWLQADVMWLSQGLQNLLGNAAKYTEPGGRIVVKVRRDDAVAEITVSDTGIGIAREDLSEIFELYVQVRHGEGRGPGEGLGIGLYLVRLVVEAHGGNIEASSAGRGCGSQFTIRLPCATASLPL
jgi:signal transduction histidine kinase